MFLSLFPDAAAIRGRHLQQQEAVRLSTGKLVSETVCKCSGRYLSLTTWRRYMPLDQPGH